MRMTADEIVQQFNAVFAQVEQTQLIAQGAEPLYIPAGFAVQTELQQWGVMPYHRIIFRADYPSSALHEIAHWCIAGPQRRQLLDYGYWYQPEGREVSAQQLFEQVEVKPQALEWIFSQAVGLRFQVSVDNLSLNFEYDSSAFQASVSEQKQRYLLEGLPLRAQIFLQALNKNKKQLTI